MLSCHRVFPGEAERVRCLVGTPAFDYVARAINAMRVQKLGRRRNLDRSNWFTSAGRRCESDEMNIDQFHECLEPFLQLLSEHLLSPKALSLRNAYIKVSGRDQYLHVFVELDQQPSEFTVCYDRFYSVPVLYYCDLKNIAKAMEINAASSGQHTAHNLAVDIHPVLQRPFLYVHPCETQQLMESSRLQGLELLVFWFATHIAEVEPSLQLRVPLTLAETTEYSLAEQRRMSIS